MKAPGYRRERPWWHKNDQELDAQDIAAMREMAEQARTGMTYKFGWAPHAEIPLAHDVRLYATVRDVDDQPVAELQLFDRTGDHRSVHLSRKSALKLLVELAKFVFQLES